MAASQVYETSHSSPSDPEALSENINKQPKRLIKLFQCFGAAGQTSSM